MQIGKNLFEIDEFKVKKIKLVFNFLSIIYLFMGFYYFMSSPGGGGDESLFIADLDLIKSAGWYDAIAKNVSIPYMILVYPFSLFLKNFIALRLVNVLLLLLFFLYFSYVAKVKFSPVYFYLIFFITSAGYFYNGTNDCLFFITTIIFLNETNNAVLGKKVNFNFALTALIISFFTRELLIIYTPVILLGIFILYRSKVKFTIKSIIPLCIFIFLLIFNYPSLKQNHALSYDKKVAPVQYEVNWAQRQYLAQLLVNKGELANYQHPSWEETSNYLKKNGKNSLPDSTFKSIFFDFKLTLNEFFKDFAYSITYSFRSLGLMFLFSILFCINQIKKNRKLELEYFSPFSTLMMLAIFSFIIISYVELRWLAPVFVLTIIYYSHLEEEKKISNTQLFLNYFFLSAVIIYGVLRMFIKL